MVLNVGKRAMGRSFPHSLLSSSKTIFSHVAFPCHSYHDWNGMVGLPHKNGDDFLGWSDWHWVNPTIASWGISKKKATRSMCHRITKNTKPPAAQVDDLTWALGLAGYNVGCSSWDKDGSWTQKSGSSLDSLVFTTVQRNHMIFCYKLGIQSGIHYKRTS